MAADFDPQLRAAMLRWAAGDLGATAAVQLLIDTGWLPEKLANAGCTRALSDEPGLEVIAPQFHRALADDGRLITALSHSEWALLQIAATLNGSAEINLHHALGRLDQSNARHAMTAFSIALGGARPR